MSNAVSVRSSPKPFGWQVLGAFVAFFLLIIAVNTVFIYTALGTHTGVITDKAYEKGLDHDAFLEKARASANWSGRPRFENGTLSWNIVDEEGVPKGDLSTSARFVRPVQDGYDFRSEMVEDKAGVYSVSPEFPLKGLWKVYLFAKDENGKEFRMSYSVQAK